VAFRKEENACYLMWVGLAMCWVVSGFVLDDEIWTVNLITNP